MVTNIDFKEKNIVANLEEDHLDEYPHNIRGFFFSVFYFF
jgi:hypothetical protein